jgi:hypothetical protein
MHIRIIKCIFKIMVYDIFQKGFSFENTLKYKHNLFLTSAYYIKTIRKYKKKYI